MRSSARARYLVLFVPVIAAFALFAVGPATRPAAVGREEGPAPSALLRRYVIPGTDEVQLIVELEEPSVIAALAGALPTGLPAGARLAAGAPEVNLKSAAAADAGTRVAAAQRRFADRLKSVDGARVQAGVDLVLDAVIVRVPTSQYSTLRRLPGVRRVHFSRPQRMDLDAAAQLQNSQALWNRVGGNANAGRGAKIGIIDTGIDIDNPMFIDPTLTPPAGYPKGDGTFTNNKVIVARQYIDLLAYPQTVRTAIDEVGHGSFVAGCAAGKQVTAPLATIAGTAPGAFLGSYKVFGTPGINDTTTTGAIVTAINAAVSDGMDVINLSLGALDYVPQEEDPEITAVNAATAAGVVVVVSAGNGGPEPHTIGNPGTADRAITVGAVRNSRILANLLRATAPQPVPEALQNVPYTNGTGPAIPARIDARRIVDVATLEATGEACSPLPASSLAGSIAFIKRGNCLFSEKVTNAATAGATAVVVYNHLDGSESFPMGGLATTTIPAVMVSNRDGLALKNFIAANTSEVRVEIEDSQNPQPKPVEGKVVSDFSSVGPGSDYNLKPDLVAVGESVYSAGQNNNSEGALYSSTQFVSGEGTSFSSPMVAGAAAALKVLNPSMSPDGIKSLLVNTASRSLTVLSGAVPNLLQGGAGMLDLDAASTAGAVFSPQSLNFGVHSYPAAAQMQKTVTITNTSSSTDQYIITVEDALRPGPSVSLSRTSTGNVGPGETATVDVVVTASSPLTGGFQGFVVIGSTRSGQWYRVPYWAALYEPNPSRVLRVAKSGGGSGAYPGITEALRDAQPGNVIEISDDGEYLGPYVIGTSLDGLPLHGVTLRAAGGRVPVIRTSSESDAGIYVIGARDVLIQGLTFEGGQSGIMVEQPSSIYPASATIDRCQILGSTGGADPAGITMYGRGSIFVTETAVSDTDGYGIAAWDGGQVTVLRSTIRRNPEGGIVAYDANIQILKSTVSGNNSPGGYLAGCSGTIDGSTFSDNLGGFGDGIEIVDGNLTVSNTLFESNSRAGIGIFSDLEPGGRARIFGNTFHQNGYGALLNPGRDVVFDRNLFEVNGRGLRLAGTSTATLTNNVIVGSTSGTAGDGIQVSGTSNLRLIHNTIINNVRAGVAFTTGATLAAENCIIAGNTGGDLDGVRPADVSSSLVGDGSAPPNKSGDPELVAPNEGNYEPGPGSPALDSGSNAAAGVPFLDFNGRLRVAAGGSNPGDGVVDMGAVEAGSAYPLVFPLLANGTQPLPGDDFTTGIAVLNKNDSAVSAGFNAYSSSGGLLPSGSNPSSRSFDVGAQVPILGFQLFGFDQASRQLGAVLATSARRLVGFFLIFDRDFSRIADGTEVSDATGTNLLLMRHISDATARTAYTVFNPGASPANITATLYTTSGSTVGTARTALVSPKGSTTLNFDDVTLSSGYVRVLSNQPVTGVELFGDSTELSALRATQAGTEGTVYFPHYAVNGGFSTLLGILNGADRSTDVVLTAFTSDGVPVGVASSRTLAAGAMLFESVATMFSLPPGPLSTGYIVAHGTKPGLTGFTAFRYESGGTKSAAAVPAASVPQPQLLFSHIAHQVAAGAGGTYQTGIALLNPFGVEVTFSMRVFNGAGTLVAEKTEALAARSKVARVLSHPVPGAGYFTQPLPLGSGHVEVNCDYGLLGFELFYTETLSQLASVPAQVP